MLSDNPIVLALREEIITQLEIQGFDSQDISVTRGNQPTSQHSGAVKNTKKYQVFITPITRNKVVMSKTTRIDIDQLKTDYLHNKIITFQIDCLTDFDHSDINSIDANNFSEIVNNLLMHFDALKTLREKGVSVVTVGAVRPSYNILNSGVYESAPSFDLQINYNSQYTKDENGTSEVIGEYYGV